MRILLFTLILLFPVTSAARILYVSVDGNDLNAGTIDSPFKTISKGVSVAVAGDTIMVRGGTHIVAGTTSISKNGTSINKFYLLAYPGENPVLDYSTAGSGSRGITLSGSWWVVRGLDIMKAPDNGMLVRGSNNLIEQCIFRENGDTGLQLDGGASNNRIINCDSYFNADPGQGNADGFAPKLTVGSGNYFYGCRAWQNSDDGWDGYLRGTNNVTTVLENCWTFRNGYLKNGNPSLGNGNGFKMGGSDNRDLAHNMVLINCLAFDNRVKGFDQNNNRGSMTLYNPTAYRNGINYSIAGPIDSGKTVEVKNAVVFGNMGSLAAFVQQATNSWMPQFTVTADDFLSSDTTGVRGPRQSDGSLPVLPFMRLAPGSDLIDAGTNLGLPFNGSAPDLGCFETDGTTSIAELMHAPQVFHLEQNYPNPFNPATAIRFSVPVTGFATLDVYNLVGQKVATVFEGVADAGMLHSVTFDGSGLASGVYIYTLRTAGRSDSKKFVLMK